MSYVFDSGVYNMAAVLIAFTDQGHRSTFPFLELPSEIRNRIYSLVLPSGFRFISEAKEDDARLYYFVEKRLLREKRFTEFRKYSEDPYRQPMRDIGTYPLFLVSKQVFLEAVHVFNRQMELRVEIKDFEQVFRVSPYGRMAMAQDLTICFNAPFDQGYTFGDLIPLRMATNLTILMFLMEPDSIRREHWDSFCTTLRILMTRFKYVVPLSGRERDNPSHGSWCLPCAFNFQRFASKDRDCMEIEGLENDIIEVIGTEMKAKPVAIYTYDYCRPCQFFSRFVVAGLSAGKCINDSPEDYHKVPCT